MCCPSCIVRCPQLASNDISIITGQISSKIDRFVPWEVLFQNCSNRSTPLHKMAARAKNRKNFKQHLRTIQLISTELDRIVPWDVFFQNCSNCVTPLHEMAARAKKRKYFRWHLLCNCWAETMAFKYKDQVLHLKQMFSGELFQRPRPLFNKLLVENEVWSNGACSETTQVFSELCCLLFIIPLTYEVCGGI